MSEIRTRPASKEFRSNFDRIFRKADRPRGETVTGSLSESSHSESSHQEGAIPTDIKGWPLGGEEDLGEFRTVCCCTDDPHFGG